MTDTEKLVPQTPPEPETSRLSAMALGDTAQAAGTPEPVTNLPALAMLIGLFAWLWFVNPVYFMFAVGLVVMIFLHELGHYMTARWTGMKATQFFIGFGPTIFSRVRTLSDGDELEVGVKAIPAGAFVRIIGMNNLDPVAPADERRAYRNATFPRRMLVITAGSIMHFLQAILLFTLAFTVIGQFDRDSSEWSVAEISRLDTGETPSVEAGIQLGDRIAAVDGVVIGEWGDLVETIRGKPGETVLLDVIRDGETIPTEVDLAVVPTENVGDIGYLGISPEFPRARENVFIGVTETARTGWAAIATIPTFFTPEKFQSLGGWLLDGRAEVGLADEEAAERPLSLIGATRIAGSVAEIDWTAPIILLASLNVFIGVFNLAPLLPLDGGHAVIAMYERIRTRDRSRPYRADFEKMLPVTYVVIVVLVLLGATTMILDITRPIS